MGQEIFTVTMKNHIVQRTLVFVVLHRHGDGFGFEIVQGIRAHHGICLFRWGKVGL